MFCFHSIMAPILMLFNLLITKTKNREKKEGKFHILLKKSKAAWINFYNLMKFNKLMRDSFM